MNSLVKVLPNVKKFNEYMFNVNKKLNPIMLSGLTDVGKVHLAYATKFYSDRPMCIITYNELQAKKIIKDLEYFKEKVEFFPKREIVSYDYIAESKDLLYQRISCMNNIINKKAKIIVTTIEAVNQRMISKDVLYKNLLKLKVGDTIQLDELKEKLVLLGYERYDLIEGKGQFSVRGGIIDIAFEENIGTRIELWGDEIDSIRLFNISTQRSTEMVNEIDVYPAFEMVLESNLEDVCEKIKENNKVKSLKEKVEEDIEQIKSGEYLNKIDRYFDSFYSKTSTLLDYLDDDYLIFLDEIGKIKARQENILKDNENIVKDLVERNKIVPNILENMNNFEKFSEKLDKKQVIYLEKQDLGFVDKKSMHAKRNGYSFSYREVKFFRSSMDLLFKEIQEARKQGKRTVILSRKRGKC